jgi:hypothetical protein
MRNQGFLDRTLRVVLGITLISLFFVGLCSAGASSGSSRS